MPLKLGDLGWIHGPVSLLLLKEQFDINMKSNYKMGQAWIGTVVIVGEEERLVLRRTLKGLGDLCKEMALSLRGDGQNISRSSFNRIVYGLGFHPYVLVKTHALLANNPAQRLNFCRWFLTWHKKMRVSWLTFWHLTKLFFSLNSEVNTKNVVK